MQTDHYTTLGVHDGATQAELDAAYAFWSRRYERRGRQSVEQLRALELAYSALSDEETRAAHDRSLNGGVAAAIACARCGRMDGELCVSVFAIVGSFLIWGRRIAYGNVWCRRCTRIAVFRANAVTTLLGWWGFGFIDAADAL
ncbi:MAG: DnaJ domain-containing protein, partial [Gaiellales bacterium]